MPPSPLPFEQDIQRMEELLDRMESGGDTSNADEIRRIRRELTNLLLVEGNAGQPIAPLEVRLLSRDGVFSTPCFTRKILSPVHSEISPL